MNKVVCSICGTSYPESVAECPICGYARSSDHSSENNESTYTRVPGGRFSKSNVRKRNQAAQKTAPKPAPTPKSTKKKEEKAGAGLMIVIILLLLAIIAVVGYIALRFFMPDNSGLDVFEQLRLPAIFQQKETEPEEELPETIETEAPVSEPVLCQNVILDQAQISFETIGETFEIGYQLSPAEAEEDVIFTSSDLNVATVDEFGLVTAAGEGSATITVSCGSASAQCQVSCVLPTEPPTEESVTISLNRKEITFTSEGESWLLYDGPVSVEEILWTSDDNKVATVEKGKVVAVGNGDTTIYGFYKGQTVVCSIHCDFAETEDDSGKVTEDSGESGDGKTYKLYNPYGNADDVTTKVGRKFTLKLVDQYKNTVEGVEWSVKDSDICSCKDGVVKALSAGTTKVIATYKGKTYSCIVRVNK